MMKHLLERWSQLEPHLCHKQLLGARIEAFTIQLNGQWENILASNVNTDEALMKIWWAVQQAIIEKGWRLESRYGSSIDSSSYTWHFWINKYEGYADSNNVAEALLTAYLKVLDANP